MLILKFCLDLKPEMLKLGLLFILKKKKPPSSVSTWLQLSSMNVYTRGFRSASQKLGPPHINFQIWWWLYNVVLVSYSVSAINVLISGGRSL